MRHVNGYVFTLFLLLVLSAGDTLAQQGSSRRETARKIESLREEIKLLEAELLAPARRPGEVRGVSRAAGHRIDPPAAQRKVGL